MNINIGKRGTSFLGAAQYYLHDKPYKDETGTRVNPKTSERVGAVEFRNLASDHEWAAHHEMRRTAEDQQALQKAAGLKPTKCKEPVKTISLNWHPDDQPSHAQMIDAADDYMHHMGWSELQAVYVIHTDTPHRHIHITLNMVHPETGKTADDWQDKTRSQPWGLAYERAHGRIQSTKRLDRDYQVSHREPQPKIPHGLEKEGRAIEAPYLAATATAERNDRTDRDLLHARHTREREGFFATAKAEFKAARQDAFHEVRTEFHQDWKHHFESAKLLRRQAQIISAWNADRAFDCAKRGEFGPAWQAMTGKDVKDGFDPVVLVEQRIKADRDALAKAQQEERRQRQDAACKQLYETRDQRFLEIKERQKEERAELREMVAAADAGRPINRERLNYLLHGDTPLPTSPGALISDLRRANDNTQKFKVPAGTNDNRASPPVLVPDDAHRHFAEPAVILRRRVGEGIGELLRPDSPFQGLFSDAHDRQQQAQAEEGAQRRKLYHAALLTRTLSMDSVQMSALRDLQDRRERSDRQQERAGRFLSPGEDRQRNDTERER